MVNSEMSIVNLETCIIDYSLLPIHFTYSSVGYE